MLNRRVGAWLGFALIALGSGTAPAASCDEPHPGWIFCEDFSGDLSLWDPQNRELTPYKTIITDPGPLQRSSNRVFRLRVPEGRGGSGIGKTFTPDEWDVLYARWYMYYEPGFDFTARNHGGGLHAGDRWMRGVAGQRPQGDDWFTVQFEYVPASSSTPPLPYLYAYYRGMGMDCADPDGRCWGDHIPCMISDAYCDRVPELRVDAPLPALEHARWYCVELMVDAGNAVSSEADADGVVNLWLDGTEYGPWGERWLRTSPQIRLNHFWLGLFHHEEHSVEGILYDDVVVSTQRIGCHGDSPPRAPAVRTE